MHLLLHILHRHVYWRHDVRARCHRQLRSRRLGAFIPRSPGLLGVHALQPLGAPEVEEREGAANHPVAVPAEVLPRRDRRADAQEHERRGGVVQKQDRAHGAQRVVDTLDQRGLRRRVCLGSQNEGPDVGTIQASDSLYKATEGERKVIASRDAMLTVVRTYKFRS